MKKKLSPAVPIEIGLYRQLRDPQAAAYYLNEAFKDGDADGILLAMHDVAKAFGMSKVANTLKVHRVSLHKMLRKNGNPSFRTFLGILGEFEIQLTVTEKKKAA